MDGKDGRMRQSSAQRLGQACRGGWMGWRAEWMRRSSAQPLGLACRDGWMGWMGWTAEWKDEMMFHITAWGG